MEHFLTVPIGALIASILAVVFLHASEMFKTRGEVLIQVVGFCDEIYHHLRDFHTVANADYNGRALDLTVEDYQRLGSELSELLTSASVHEKMAIAFGDKEELGIFLALNKQFEQVASTLFNAASGSGSNEGQQIKQLFEDKIDPLRSELLQNLVRGAKFTGILFDIYKSRMPAFYRITSVFRRKRT